MFEENEVYDYSDGWFVIYLGPNTDPELEDTGIFVMPNGTVKHMCIGACCKGSYKFVK